MQGQFSRALIAAAASAVLLAGVAAAQQEAPAFQSRDWRGRPIDYVCKAAAGDTEGLRQALIRQELFRIGADTKAETGWYYGDRLRAARLKTKEASGSEIVDRIKQRLRADAESVPTSVLIYDVGVRRGQAMLCAWLITSDGIAAVETVGMTAW